MSDFSGGGGVPRSPRWLIVIAAAATVAYVTRRVRRRSRGEVEDWVEVPDARLEPAPAGQESPAGPVAMVARMEASSTSQLATQPTTNGSGSATASSGPRLVDLPPVELPPRRKLSGAVLASIACVLVVAAIALGATALATNLESDDESATAALSPQSALAISLLAKPSTQRVPIAGSGGRIILAVGSRGKGMLVLDRFGLAPAGKDYQAWVIRPNAEGPLSAGIFSGVETIVPLSIAVRPGAVVAITIEQAGGVRAPTQTPKLVAQAAST